MNIITKQLGRVLIVQLNRPRALNALNTDLMNELVSVLQSNDKNPHVGCFIITGSDKAFAAGADIKEMCDKSYEQIFEEDFFSGWEALANIRTPKIAAVNGYALGGGCELAMMCDIIYASDTAKFGQPEITLGVIPGIGGSQRLTKLIGKVKAMDLILTGRMMNAQEAENAGLVARVFSSDELMLKTIAAAETIASYSKTTAIVAREVVDRAIDLNLHDGILFERRSFHALFATSAQQEGMQAFIEKRKPIFNNHNQLQHSH